MSNETLIKTLITLLVIDVALIMFLCAALHSANETNQELKLENSTLKLLLEFSKITKKENE